MLTSPATIDDVVQTGLCIGCGICTHSSAIGQMRYSASRAQFVPVLDSDNRHDSLAYALCPGKGYPIVRDSKELFESTPYDQELGHVYSCCAAVSTDKEILANASSGGVMSHIAIYLLEQKIVDSVVVTHFVYGDAPRAVCTLARSRSEILNSQGSKYCPVDLSAAINEIRLREERVAVLGTPCQIAGIRNIQKNDPSFARKVVLTVGNFCGGVKDYDNVDLLARHHGVNPRTITAFAFRGNGQPGRMLIEDVSGKRVEVPYPAYNGHTGISKHLRCHLCVDATGELADIACGDAWLPRFQKQEKPWSIIITRTKRAAEIVDAMENSGLFTTAPISLDEVKRSQKENLHSKKVRQKSRRHLYRLLGWSVPSFDGGFRDNAITLRTEIEVLVKHRVKRFLERLRVYYPAYRLFKQWPRTLRK